MEENLLAKSLAQCFIHDFMRGLNAFLRTSVAANKQVHLQLFRRRAA